tara:strand:+ start:2121 stop:2318 length:198 start_codon:yes stop_codon:yes gene_type:complete
MRITINQALDKILGIQGNLKIEDKKIKDFSLSLLNAKIQLGGKTILDESSLETYNSIIEEHLEIS